MKKRLGDGCLFSFVFMLIGFAIVIAIYLFKTLSVITVNILSNYHADPLAALIVAFIIAISIAGFVVGVLYKKE